MQSYRHLFIAVCLFASFTQALPIDYGSYTAKQKQDWLWEKIREAPYEVPPHQLPNSKALCPLEYGFAQFKDLFLPNWLVPRFIHESDEMPLEDFGKKKAIHTYGTVAKARWVPTPHSNRYDGIFKTGGIGLIRASLAKPYLPGESYRPGFALKIFQDGRPSINFHVMDSLDGQGEDFDFFAREFSNIVNKPKSSTLRLIELTSFKAAISSLMMENGPVNSRTLPLDEAAPNPPRQIFFVPNPYSSRLLEGSKESDVRIQLGRIAFSPNEAVYDIYAGDSIQDSEEVGRLYIESEFIASEYGDTKLFFKHQRRTLR